MRRAEEFEKDVKSFRLLLKTLYGSFDGDLVFDLHDQVAEFLIMLRAERSATVVSKCVMFHVTAGSTVREQISCCAFLDFEGTYSIRGFLNNLAVQHKEEPVAF